MTNIVVPSLGESITEAVLLRWLKEDGDHVAEAEPVAELETDKTNVDIPAPVAGAFKRGSKAGDSVKVGQPIGQVDESAKGAAPAAKPVAKAAEASAGAPAARIEAPAKVATATVTNNDDLRPSVRRIVEENKLDASNITPTGPGGRIIKEDAMRAAESGPRRSPKPPTPPPTQSLKASTATAPTNGEIVFDEPRRLASADDQDSQAHRRAAGQRPAHRRDPDDVQ